MADKMYNVVFQYTRETGGYAGVITWASFRNENDFKEWYTPDIEKRQRVLEQGVTQARAIKLVGQTPAACDLAACVQEATNPETGQVNNEILEIKLANTSLTRSMRNKRILP